MLNLAKARAERAIAAGFSVLLAGPAFALLRGFGLPAAAAVPVVLAVAVAVVLKLSSRVPAAITDAVTARRAYLPAWLILTLFAAVQLGRLSIFMSDPSAREHSVLPSSAFITPHSCYTSYFEAARAGRTEPNIYLSEFYRPDARAARLVDGFNVDSYEYPPPFLVLPAIGMMLSQSFLTHRTVFFALECFLLVGAMLAFARTLRGAAEHRFVLLIPVMFLLTPVRMCLQIGNFQLAAIALCLLAWASFARGRDALGGVALGFATVSKLFPGLLVLYLLARRRFRPAVATMIAGAVFSALAFMIFGGKVYDAFFSYHVPRLASGEAFPALKFVPPAILINHSVYGIVLKLKLFGATSHGMELAGKIAWIYTLVVVGIVGFLARRREAGRDFDPMLALALLALGALRAPFLPQEYGTLIPILVLFVFAAEAAVRSRGQAVAFLFALTMLSIVIPLDWFRPNYPPPVLVSALAQLTDFAVVTASVLAAAHRRNLA